MAFLTADNFCGQNLLKITSRGSAILAELLRLSSHVPDIFVGADSIKGLQKQKNIEILFDFHYLRDPDECEQKIGSNSDLLELDQEFQENHTAILHRFYMLFESIWRYQADFATYIDDVQSGFYIQHSLDDIFLEMTGKQLLCEALYLYGTMLLLLEERIPGNIREKIMIAVYRYSGDATLEHVDEVCKLCRGTGYLPGKLSTKPRNHPSSFFSRFAPDADFVRSVIGCLQTDDIYQMTTSFPNPEHRSTRLSQQGSILFTVLYFAPEILSTEFATMRELADKYFNDNWVIALYMGHTIDLTLEWAGYPAARTALENTINIGFVRKLNEKNSTQMQNCIDQLKVYLTEGVLHREYLLDNIKPLMKCVRSCNVALRWRLMHRRCRNETYSKIIVESVSPITLVTLLLSTSQLEFILKELLLQLLAGKDMAWTEGMAAAANRLIEISEYFTGEKALSRVKKDEKLMTWFSGLAFQVQTLDLEEDHGTSTGRRIQGLIAALEDVQQFEVIDVNMQIKTFLNEIRDLLRQMIRTVNIKDELLNVLENVSDFSYAWEALSDYLDIFQERIRSDSLSVVSLRAVFLKTASILDVPLIRITAVDSPDAISVAEYYSGELIEFVRLVLEVIPISIFKIMNDIEYIQTNKMILIPTRLEAKDLRIYSQLESRSELSKLTCQASVFTEGILIMEKTLLGIIQVEPRLILHEGLRRELVRQIAKAMHITVYSCSINKNKITAKLSQLAAILDGLKRSIEHLQDYIGVAGLKMFQEEMSRVINYNIEQEANRYLKKKIFDNASQFQSKTIPIPKFDIIAPSSSTSQSSSISLFSLSSSSFSPSFDSDAVNFMGHIMKSLLHLTDTCTKSYSPASSVWYEYGILEKEKEKENRNFKKGMSLVLTESCGIRTFALLERSLGAVGLRGLDRLFAFRTVHEFNFFFKFYEEKVSEQKIVLDQMRQSLFPEHRIVAATSKLYTSGVAELEKLMSPILLCLCRIGQGQLIRRQIAYTLQLGCQTDAHMLYQTLDTFNTSLMNDVVQHYRQPDTSPYPKSENPVLAETAALLQACGLEDPFDKIYVTSQPMDGLPVLLFFFLLSQLPKMEYNNACGTLVSKKGGDPMDGTPLVAGLACLLKQMHPSATVKLMSYLGQYVRTCIQHTFFDSDVEGRKGKPAPEIQPLVLNILLFMDQLCKFSSISRTVVHAHVPAYIFDALKIPVTFTK